MKSPSTDPLILGLQEIFRGINSAEGIQRNRLEELLKNTIFPPLSWDLFRIDKQADVFQFILSFFDVLEKKGEKAAECFLFKIRNVSYEKLNPANSDVRVGPNICLQLYQQGFERQEIPGEFMQMLRKFSYPLEVENGSVNDKIVNGVICKEQILNPPQVLLIRINNYMYRLLSIPLKFILPPETMVEPGLVKYKLIGGIVHLVLSETLGHYIAYAKIGNGFFEFNDSHVEQISEEGFLEALKKTNAGRQVFMLAYERED